MKIAVFLSHVLITAWTVVAAPTKLKGDHGNYPSTQAQIKESKFLTLL
jgi:hypothetical protein